MNLDQFLSSTHPKNAWIKERNINVYVRKSVRLLDAKSPTPYPCLDIASVEVHEKHRGLGIFTAFLTRFEKEAKKLNRAVYIESIQETRLVKFLTARDYKFISNSSDIVPTMFKLSS